MLLLAALLALGAGHASAAQSREPSVQARSAACWVLEARDRSLAEIQAEKAIGSSHSDGAQPGAECFEVQFARRPEISSPYLFQLPPPSFTA